MPTDTPDLASLLKTPPIKESAFTRDSDVLTFEAKYPNASDPSMRNIIMTSPKHLTEERDWKAEVESRGSIPVPPGYRVRLVEMRHQTHGWTRTKQGKDALTAPTWWYRFAVEPTGYDPANTDDLIKAIHRRRAPGVKRSTGTSVFHHLGGDLQLGKGDGDGVEGTVGSITRSLELAVAEFKTLRRFRSIGVVHLAWLGDCIEGNQSQGGKNMWRTKLPVSEQNRIFRRLMTYGIELFAPLVEVLEVDVVNGNHDRMQDFQKTRSDDGHATEAAIAVSDALELNPTRFGHVKVFVPPIDFGYHTRQIGTSSFTMAHGHQWRRGKAWDWWAGQALNLQNPGAAHFLLHGHEHVAAVDTKRERTVICTPTYEDRSQWWHEKTGDLARRGAITMTTLNGEFSDLRIL